MVQIDPEDVCVDVMVRHPLDSDLRDFTGDVFAYIDEGTGDLQLVGEITGWLSWDPEGHSLVEAGDNETADAGLLGWVADQITEQFIQVEEGRGPMAAVLINTPRLEPKFRGNRILGTVIDALLDTLQLDPASTVVVVTPEPQREEGGPLAPGPDREQALANLRRHYETQGFERWVDTDVWWRPLFDTGQPPDLRLLPGHS